MPTNETDPLFAFHKLNGLGQARAKTIAQDFTDLLVKLGLTTALGGREGAIVRTKLEEACFFAKKAMALQPENQEPGFKEPAKPGEYDGPTKP